MLDLSDLIIKIDDDPEEVARKEAEIDKRIAADLVHPIEPEPKPAPKPQNKQP